MRILVLCTGNSCRSQMAEGWLKAFSPESWVIMSAGLEAHGLNPRAVQVMKETGIDISQQESTEVDSLMDETFDLVITVCDHANEHCPYFPGKVERMHKGFRDPAKATGTEEEVMNLFREVRDEIKTWAKELLVALEQ